MEETEIQLKIEEAHYHSSGHEIEDLTNILTGATIKSVYDSGGDYVLLTIVK